MSELPRARLVRERGQAPAPTQPTPARRVPSGLIARLLFSGKGIWVLWLLLAGMICSLAEDARFTYDGHVWATVDRVHRDDDSYDVDYHFSEGGVQYQGNDTVSERPQAGSAVIVDFDRKVPERSHMRSRRRLGFFIGLAVLVAFCGFWFIRQVRIVHYLRRGRPTRGKVIAKFERQSNDSPTLWVLTFEYDDERGCTWHTDIQTENPGVLTDEPTEAILYDPQHPDRATTLDHLPGSPKLADDGSITSSGGWWFAIAPIVAVAATISLPIIRALYAR